MRVENTNAIVGDSLCGGLDAGQAGAARGDDAACANTKGRGPVVTFLRDTDPTLRDMHPSTDNLRMALGMSVMPDGR